MRSHTRPTTRCCGVRRHIPPHPCRKGCLCGLARSRSWGSRRPGGRKETNAKDEAMKAAPPHVRIVRLLREWRPSTTARALHTLEWQLCLTKTCTPEPQFSLAEMRTQSQTLNVLSGSSRLVLPSDMFSSLASNFWKHFASIICEKGGCVEPAARHSVTKKMPSLVISGRGAGKRTCRTVTLV